MPTLLFINACVRGKDSRTLALCERLLTSIKEANQKDMAFKIEEIRLSTENLIPLNYERLQRRDELLANGIYEDSMFDYANAMAQADMIVIAAPYWDIGDCNFGFQYVNALCKLYGIQHSHFVSAQGLDMEGADIEALLEQAVIEEA